MIYIKNEINTNQLILIPRYFEDPISDARLRLVNKISEYIIELDPVNYNLLPKYHSMEIVLREKLIEGEYSYTLSGVNGVESFGIAVVGDYKNEKTSYDVINKKIQYNK